MIVDGCAWLWVFRNGCGWLWIVLGGCILSRNPLMKVVSKFADVSHNLMNIITYIAYHVMAGMALKQHLL